MKSLVAAALVGLTMSTPSCSASLGLIATSADASTAESNFLGSGLFTSVALGFVPVDVFITVMAVASDGELTALERYLDAHRQEVRVALSRGQGAFVRDVAHALALPDGLVEPLGAALRAHRGALEAALTEPRPIAREQALRFIAALREALASDPRLLEHTRTRGASALDV